MSFLLYFALYLFIGYVVLIKYCLGDDEDVKSSDIAMLTIAATLWPIIVPIAVCIRYNIGSIVIIKSRNARREEAKDD